MINSENILKAKVSFTRGVLTKMEGIELSDMPTDLKNPMTVSEINSSMSNHLTRRKEKAASIERLIVKYKKLLKAQPMKKLMQKVCKKEEVHTQGLSL